ncbi:RNA-binding region-containing protein 3-like [Arctopsyche grandis]|uniref:RNA-binding region-containing protein 3-like n=1 Tax=Arctopsyche grandis TaxID=121162 RepID=UPI00406D82F7
MSNTLLIRHLCGDLETSEREDFLKYFGAHKVWFINPRSHTAFASFESREAADRALRRLHQLEVLGKRLTVEFANDKNVPQSNSNKLTDEKYSNLNHIKEFIDKINSTNSSFEFTQPPPPNISYKYPTATSHILFNIMYSLAQNTPFYTQTLHLMNKMGLNPPFTMVSENVKNYIHSCICDIGIDLPKNQPNTEKISSQLSSEESEMSCEDDHKAVNDIPLILPLKRRSNLKKINKKIKLKNMLSIMTRKNGEGRKIVVSEVFDEAVLPKINKIEIKVNSALEESNLTSDVCEVVGTIGKMDVVEKSEEEPIKADENTLDPKYVISTKELLSNKIPAKDMNSLPVFKNYNPGTPSMRLYIKNLSKDVTSKDIEGIYQRYICSDSIQEKNSFDVRVMQEGRMKGQAFVTLPSTEASEKALNETNGFILKNKPMVVQYARTANK